MTADSATWGSLHTVFELNLNFPLFAHMRIYVEFDIICYIHNGRSMTFNLFHCQTAKRFIFLDVILFAQNPVFRSQNRTKLYIHEATVHSFMREMLGCGLFAITRSLMARPLTNLLRNKLEVWLLGHSSLRVDKLCGTGIRILS